MYPSNKNQIVFHERRDVICAPFLTKERLAEKCGHESLSDYSFLWSQNFHQSSLKYALIILNTFYSAQATTDPRTYFWKNHFERSLRGSFYSRLFRCFSVAFLRLRNFFSTFETGMNRKGRSQENVEMAKQKEFFSLRKDFFKATAPSSWSKIRSIKQSQTE